MNVVVCMYVCVYMCVCMYACMCVCVIGIGRQVVVSMYMVWR
jgi:hypothetical protein